MQVGPEGKGGGGGGRPSILKCVATLLGEESKRVQTQSHVNQFSITCLLTQFQLAMGGGRGHFGGGVDIGSHPNCEI